MSILRSLAARARILRRLGAVEDELAAELQDHLEREVERQRAAGVPEDEARRRALWRVGSIEAIKEEVRDERGGRWLLDALGDARVGVRSLRRAPGFTLAVVLSLALGVAGVTAIASVLNAVVIQPLPYPDSARLHLVRIAWNAFSAPLSAADFLRLQEASGSVGDAAAYRFGAEGYTLLGLGDPLVVAGAAVTPETPRVLGVPAALGRWFSERDEGPEALISDALWRRRFGASPAAIGRLSFSIAAGTPSSASCRPASTFLARAAPRSGSPRAWTSRRGGARSISGSPCGSGQASQPNRRPHT